MIHFLAEVVEHRARLAKRAIEWINSGDPAKVEAILPAPKDGKPSGLADLERAVWPPITPENRPGIFNLLDLAQGMLHEAKAAGIAGGAKGVDVASGNEVTPATIMADLREAERDLQRFRDALPELGPQPADAVAHLVTLGRRFRRAADLLVAAEELQTGSELDDTACLGCAYPATCDAEAKIRGKQASAWTIARERGEDYIRNHPFPGVNALAERSGCNVHTMRKAIEASKELTRAQAAAAVARPAPPANVQRSPAEQAVLDEAQRELIELAPPERRAELNNPEMKDQMGKMGTDALQRLLEDAREQAAARARARAVDQ